MYMYHIEWVEMILKDALDELKKGNLDKAAELIKEAYKESNGVYPEDEYDGQPDEQKEWEDFGEVYSDENETI